MKVRVCGIFPLMLSTSKQFDQSSHCFWNMRACQFWKKVMEFCERYKVGTWFDSRASGLIRVCFRFDSCASGFNES